MPPATQQSFDIRQVTIVIIFLMFILGGLTDVVLDKFGGNQATISRVWMDMIGKRPELIAELAYALTLFFLHLCFGRLEPLNPNYTVRVTKILVALLPIFRMVFVVFGAEPTDDDAYEAVLMKHKGQMFGLTMVGILAAIPAWYYCVPQHVQFDEPAP